jgi:arylsulfatase A-like enzyme
MDPAAPPMLQTPNLDELGGHGAFFRRAYAECPSCMPARRTLYSGLAPAANGMVGMTNYPFELPAKLPALLTQAGYQTELVGKSHLPPTGKRHGFERARFSDTTGGGPLDRYEEWLTRQGFHHLLPGIGHGVDANGWVGRPHHLPEHLMHSFWAVSEALDFLLHRDASCPFFLNLNFIDPHPPLTPPAAHYERYARQQLPPPQVGAWAEADAPACRKGQAVAASRIHLDPTTIHHARAAYYGMVNFVDDQLGRLMNVLRRRGLLDNSLVVFTSDHGEMLGDHHRYRKCFLYEASARVPLLMRFPRAWGIKPMTSTAPVGLQDIMPTLLDAAGLPVPAHCTGRSLLPLVRGQGPAPRQVLHCEHMDQYGRQDGAHMLTDGRYKYFWYTEHGTEQLFDLEHDPHECHELSQTPAGQALLPTWRQEMIKVLTCRPEGFTDGHRLIPGRPYTHMIPGYQEGQVLPFV